MVRWRWSRETRENNGNDSADLGNGCRPFGVQQGIDLALEMDQDNFPPGFQVLWGDTESDPTTGAAEMKRLAGEGAVLFVAGTTSDTARALLPVLDDTDSIAVSPSASAPSLTKDSRRFFRVFASDELEGRRAGRFLYDDQDKTTVLIYAVDSAQARGIEPPFRLVFEQAMGGEVVGRASSVTETRPLRHSDIFGGKASKARSAPPRPFTRARSSKITPNWWRAFTSRSRLSTSSRKPR